VVKNARHHHSTRRSWFVCRRPPDPLLLELDGLDVDSLSHSTHESLGSLAKATQG